MKTQAGGKGHARYQKWSWWQRLILSCKCCQWIEVRRNRVLFGPFCGKHMSTFTQFCSACSAICISACKKCFPFGGKVFWNVKFVSNFVKVFYIFTLQFEPLSYRTDECRSPFLFVSFCGLFLFASFCSFLFQIHCFLLLLFFVFYFESSKFS